MELDVTLFGARIAPAFGVTRRFFGTEPTCATTRAYNAAMRRVLPALGVEAVELERARVGGGAAAAAISASSVRAALAAGDDGALAALVPATTLAYLLSDEGRAVRARLGRPAARKAGTDEDCEEGAGRHHAVERPDGGARARRGAQRRDRLDGEAAVRPPHPRRRGRRAVLPRRHGGPRPRDRSRRARLRHPGPPRDGARSAPGRARWKGSGSGRSSRGVASSSRSPPASR